MGKPTLLVPGNLIPNCINNKKCDENLDDIVPINYILDWFKARMGVYGSLFDRVLILQSDVGSGKTTVLPATIYKEFINTKRKDIIITQPRVLTSVEKPKEMASDGNAPWLELGRNIGYSTGPMKESKSEPGIMFQTVETLKMKLIPSTDIVANDKKIMDKVGFIIIDEVHERSTALDATLYLLKQFLIRNIGNVDMPFVVLTSATFDRIKFAKYFLHDDLGSPCDSIFENNDNIYNNIINVRGSASAREFHWPQYNYVNYIDAAIDTVYKINDDFSDDPEHECDIMIFCMDPADIKKLITKLTKLDDKKQFIIIQIDGIKYKDPVESTKIKKYLSMTLNEVKKELNQPNAKRRVYVVNVVAETGLTVRTLKHCIDSGWDKASEFNPVYNCNLLLTKPITQNAMIQRYGRIGRVFPGHFYPLYTKQIADSLLVEKFPDILTSDITDLLITSTATTIAEQATKKIIGNGYMRSTKTKSQYKLINVNGGDNLDNLDNSGNNKIKLIAPKFLDLLPLDSVNNAYNRMHKLGLLDSRILNIVKLIPSRITVEHMRMILAGYVWGVNIPDLITIAVFTSIPSNTLLQIMPPMGKKDKSKDDIKVYNIDKILSEFIDLKKSPKMTPKLLRTIICDDFIEMLFVERWIIKTLKETKSFSILHEKCNQVGIKFGAVCEQLEIRDQIINAFVLGGLKINEFNKKTLIFDDNFIDNITIMKRCIYEGFKFNKLTYKHVKQNVEKNISQQIGYFTERGLLAKQIKSLNGFLKLDNPPKIMLYNSILIKQDKGSWNDYIADVDKISIMDGYIQ